MPCNFNYLLTMAIENTSIFKRKVALVGAAVGLTIGLFDKQRTLFKTLGYVAFMYGTFNIIGDSIVINQDIKNANGTV